MSHALHEIVKQPVQALAPSVLRFLRDHPIEEPRLDPALIQRVLDTAPALWSPDMAVGLRLYLVHRNELLKIAFPGEL